MSTLEVTNEGETIKIETGDTTTASDVIDILNEKWPVCAKLLSDGIADMGNAFRDASKIIEDAFKFEKRKKAIDRIAWKAENKQRYQKGGHWK